MVTWPWLILFLPFIAFVIVTFIPERNRKWAGWIASASLAGSFLLSLSLALPMFREKHIDTQTLSLDWIRLPNFAIDFGFLIDPLSLMMLLVVTGVGSLIFYYSIEYMEHDPGFKRYFAGLSLFAFSMIGIVISSNLLELFIFWELVGLSSYLLIGHWYEKPEAADAGKKAFLTNRVGDFGLLIGTVLLWVYSGNLGERTLNISRLGETLSNFVQSAPHHQMLITVAMLLIFMGVMGKSAQFPLHVWLPDAMEGPTPVSALIHAATMVAAGVYLLARLFHLYLLSPFALEIIAYLGGFTAIFAATQALVQSDIKRVLAYSTLSQLGYMVMAVGLGSASIAMFHLTTHAFFKALLFLSAGSIIHAAHEQNLWNLGGLIKKMPLTATAFLIGSFALIGFWPASGFFSKDEILVLAFEKNRILYLASTATVFLTAFYMGRTIWLSLFSRPAATKAFHEPSRKMMIPLVLLSWISLAGGFLGIETFLHAAGEAPSAPNFQVIVLSTALGICGLISAFILYGPASRLRHNFEKFLGGLKHMVIRKYYMDDLYDFILRYVQDPVAKLCAWWETRVVVNGMVNGSARTVSETGLWLRKLVTGRIQTYVSIFFLGVIVMVYFGLIRDWRP